MEYMDRLNEEQRLPVTDTDGAVLVIAGAGSGKTRVLTSRIAYLIDVKKVLPGNILAITFTNKAANEMRDRLTSVIPTGQDVWVSTIHGMCVRILRNSVNLPDGIKSNFSIYSEVDKERVLKRVISEMKIESENAMKNARYHISNAKNKCLSPDEYFLENKNTLDIDTYCKIYEFYNEELRRCNALDFDELLVFTYRLLAERPEVLDYYANKFRYIHVDEFQDTNVIQYDIIKMLASVHGNIFVVGDDDQSIYGWRGAEIKNILGFNKDFKGAKVYKLERNYRSTKRILDLANTIIKNNHERSDKALWTENEEGARIETFVADEESGEAAYTAMRIRSLIETGASYSDFAVLMRINAISRAYEQEFTKYGIPFKVFGGFKFFERKEIKDLTAYMRILSNPLDNDALLRIINTPKRGIGDKTISAMVDYANKNGFMLFDSLMECDKLGLPSGAKAKVETFKKLITSLILDKETMNMSDLLDSIVNKTDFLSQFEDKTEENTGKLMNISELKNSVLEFQKLNPESGLNEYLSSITLSTDMDEIDDGNYVSIATIHSVKGLEFGNVFISGLDENIFPISRAVGDVSEMEEERRLMYVAITRARTRLFITRARSRFLFGQRQPTMQSRFVTELAEKLGIKRPIKSTEGERSYIDRMPKADDSPSPSRSFGVSSNFSRSFSRNTSTGSGKAYGEYKPGRKVKHLKFGTGTVIACHNSGEKLVCDVAFPGVGIKSLSVKFAPMELV